MTATLIEEFDVWRPGYGNAVVAIYLPGTTELAPVFYDLGAAYPGANPVTLLSFTFGDVPYGRFPQSLYVDGPYEVRVTDTGESTGVITAPVTDLAGQDASAATVLPDGGTVASPLSALFGQPVSLWMFGEVTEDAQANTNILAQAIGAAASRGGARVMLPSGTIPHLALDIPDNVTVVGQGKFATVLQCLSGEACVTLSGNFCGLAHLTLDGVQRVPNSIGLKAVSRGFTHLTGVQIKRFSRNVEFRGGYHTEWRDTDVMDGDGGVYLMGDDNSGGPVAGSAIDHFTWEGGRLGQHSDVAMQLIYEDFPVRHIRVEDVQVKDNTEIGIDIRGAQFIEFKHCEFDGNTTWLAVQDDDLDTVPARRDNTVQVLTFTDCEFNGGMAAFAGECETILFDRCKMTDIEVSLVNPANNMLIRDCVERSTTLSGVTTAWARWSTQANGCTVGRTTGTDPITAWRQRMGFGEAMVVTAWIVGVTKNVAQYFASIQVASFNRDGLELPYAGQTANFTLGNRITGAISGASGTLQAQTDGGATGTLTLVDVEGDFVDDEPLAETGGSGNGFVNLPATEPAVTVLGTPVALYGPEGAGGTATLTVSGADAVITIAGLSAETTDWTLRVDAVLSRA